MPYEDADDGVFEEEGTVRMRCRNGHEWTTRWFPPVGPGYDGPGEPVEYEQDECPKCYETGEEIDV